MMRRALTEEALKLARAKVGKLPIVEAEGEKMVVIRPREPNVALALAKTALAQQDKDLLDQIPTAGTYQWVGYFAKPKRRREAFVVDGKGEIIDALLPGDSIVPESSVRTEKDLS